VRPELTLVSVALVAALCTFAVVGDRPGARARLVAAAAALPVAYEVFRMGYYASLVPNTALAKRAGAARWGRGWDYVLNLAAPYALVVPMLAAAAWLAFGRRWSITRTFGGRDGRNLCVALAVLDGLGVDVPGMKDELQAAVESFEGLPHRLAEIEDPSGLTFVDDTLSTSPYSAMHAIEAYASRPLTVLVGGTDRGLDYAPLREFLADRELTVIGIPDSGPRIIEALKGLAGVRTEIADDLPAAVRLSRELTPDGGVVLLSPGAPSYGRYRNFEHRSEAFAAAIRESA
jgi:hypothetical protein